MLSAFADPPAPPPLREALALLLRIVRRVAPAVFGSFGVFALVCAALHPHADAALYGACGLLAGVRLGSDKPTAKRLLH